MWIFSHYILVSQPGTNVIVYINSVSNYGDVLLYSYFLILCLHEISNPAMIVFHNVPGELLVQSNVNLRGNIIVGGICKVYSNLIN